MRITITTRATHGEDPEQEVYESLDELQSMLLDSATPEYADDVLGRIRAGEKLFSVANSEDTEEYQVEE